MHGLGEATGAISVVNALPTGVGCAIGVELRVRAEVTLREGRAPIGSVEVEGDRVTPLVREAARAAVAEWLPLGVAHVAVSVGSSIPERVGLKSSSAVASAIGRAVASAAGRDPAPLEVARVAARASRSAGVSATGALDDALAGLQPGFVVTDNTADRPLLSQPVARGLEVGIWLPDGVHPPSPSVLAQFRAERPGADAAVSHALEGDFWVAMAENSSLVERVMGYPYRGLRTRLADAGAVGAGVSGLGPALAIVAPAGRLSQLLELLPSGGGRVLELDFARSTSDHGSGDA